MSDNAEIHGKILGFLMAEWARKDTRQLIGVDLLYAPGNGFKDEEIRKWERADEPDLFAEFVNVEKLVALIIEIAEGEADAKPPGKHRFILRCRQVMGSRPTHSFALSPKYRGGGDEITLAPSGAAGGGRDLQVIAGHAGQLMRINAQMFEGTIRVISQQNMNLHEQVSALIAETALLRRELEEARSTKMDREFQIHMAAEKNARTNAGFQKLLDMGAVVVAKIGAGAEAQGGGGEAQGGGGSSPLAMLIGAFYKSLRPDQIGVVLQALDMSQKMMFMEIVNLVSPPEDKSAGKAGPGPGEGPPSP